MDIVFWQQRARRKRDIIRNMSIKWGENVSGIFMAMAREFLLASHPQTSLSDSSRRRETCRERRQDVKNKTQVLERKRGRHGGSANRGVRLTPRSIIDLWPWYFSITQHTCGFTCIDLLRRDEEMYENIRIPDTPALLSNVETMLAALQGHAE